MKAHGQGADSTAIDAEVAKFDRLAAEWWDPRGPMRPLHAMNPARMGWIIGRIARRHRRDPRGTRPLDGLSVLDVGCGAGLASEVLARAGARVTGLDAAGGALSAARAHAAAGGLAIDYREGRPEALLAEASGRFDVVLALEVIEHVAGREAFCRHLAGLAAPRGPQPGQVGAASPGSAPGGAGRKGPEPRESEPRGVETIGAGPAGGLVFLSTLNRTPQSWMMAKLGAEYLLRLLPVGTHDWRMFVRPAELGAELRQAGLRVADITGLEMDPLTGRWRVGRDVGVNYLVMAVAG